MPFNQCLKPLISRQTTDYKILVGRHDQFGLKNIPDDIYTIRRIIYHPLYEDASNKYDVALLQTHVSRETFYRNVIRYSLLKLQSLLFV